MSTELRIGSLNLRAMPNPESGQIHRLAKIIAAKECDVVLLQECRRPWLDVVCQTAGMSGVHAHFQDPPLPRRAFSPDGCAIAFRKSFERRRSWRIQPEKFMPKAVHERIPEELPLDFEPMPERLAVRYSGRSVLVELGVDGTSIVVASFHGTPGSGKVGGKEVGEWKPFFPGGVAIELAELEQPFVFGI